MRNARKGRWSSLRVREHIDVRFEQKKWKNIQFAVRWQEARTVLEKKWPWLSQSTGESVQYNQTCHVQNWIHFFPRFYCFSAKVVIGDLDVAGAEAVVATITKNGGCVNSRLSKEENV